MVNNSLIFFNIHQASLIITTQKHWKTYTCHIFTYETIGFCIQLINNPDTATYQQDVLIHDILNSNDFKGPSIDLYLSLSTAIIQYSLLSIWYLMYALEVLHTASLFSSFQSDNSHTNKFEIWHNQECPEN